LLYDQNLQRKTNQKTRKVTYQVLNDRNFKENKTKSTEVQAHFHLTNYDGCDFWYVL